ncbi:GNAT family N-acetyltransferase [Paenibacillus alkalitolerans]|uniref:GNAT family N-acetyltransferase n=1 Tax=Paenibacillus alkalitolerans TaxID=2799335 RepID=UPI0018F41CCA|nr:GNAT family protein [Paenibacillus alkalitolerans]
MGHIAETLFETKDQMLISLRSPTVSDAPRLHTFVKDLLSSEQEYLLTTPTEFHLTAAQQAEWIEKLYKQENSVIIIAEKDQSIIGLLDFQGARKNKMAHVGSFGLSVRSGYRGRGIGRVLINNLIEWVNQREQIEKICLEVFSNNAAAIKLYKSVGFIEEGRQARQIRLEDGRYLDLIQMGLFVIRN